MKKTNIKYLDLEHTYQDTLNELNAHLPAPLVTNNVYQIAELLDMFANSAFNKQFNAYHFTHDSHGYTPAKAMNDYFKSLGVVCVLEKRITEQ